MADLSWLAAEAKQVHQYFHSIFYLLLTLFLTLGVLIEYFRFPLGQMPGFSTLVGRAFVAVILLITFTEVVQLISTFSDALADKLGNPNQFQLVREKMADKLKDFSWSWVKVKESITVVICYVCFVLFHFSIYLADAFFLFTWTLLYIFSPLLIVCFVLPATAGATAALYRSLIEVSLWKPVWMVMASLLWSTALSDLNKPGTDINYLSVIAYCLLLAGSLIVTPFIVHALTTSGMTTLARNFGAVTVGATVVGPKQLANWGSGLGKRTYNYSLAGAEWSSKRFFPKLGEKLEKIPRFHIPKRPIFIKPKGDKK